jgi:hypothetical protein
MKWSFPVAPQPLLLVSAFSAITTLAPSPAARIPAHDQYVGFDWFAINIDHFHSLPFDFNRRGAEHAEREFFSQWRRDTAIEKYSAAARGCSYLFGETY